MCRISTFESVVADVVCPRRLDNLFSDFKDDFLKFGKVEEKLLESRATVLKLEETLKLHQERFDRMQKRIEQLEQTESDLRAETIALHSEEAETSKALARHALQQTELYNVRQELEQKTHTLEATASELAARAKTVDDLTSVNSDLQIESQGLKAKTEELQTALDSLRLINNGQDEKLESEIRHARTEAAAYARNFQVEVQTDASNRIKKVRSECERLGAHVEGLTAELTFLKGRTGPKYCDKSTQANDFAQKKLADTCSTLSSELEAQRKRVCEIETDKARLEQTLQELDQQVEQLTAAHTQSNAESRAREEERDHVLNELRGELAKAEDERKHVEACHKHYEESAKAELKKERAKKDVCIERLQDELMHTKNCHVQKQARHESTVEQLEGSMQKQERNSEKSMTELRAKMKEIQVEKADLLAEKNDWVQKYQLAVTAQSEENKNQAVLEATLKQSVTNSNRCIDTQYARDPMQVLDSQCLVRSVEEPQGSHVEVPSTAISDALAAQFHRLDRAPEVSALLPDWREIQRLHYQGSSMLEEIPETQFSESLPSKTCADQRVNSLTTQSPHTPLQQRRSVQLSQEDRSRFTFKKPLPHPNSSSRRTPLNSDANRLNSRGDFPGSRDGLNRRSSLEVGQGGKLPRLDSDPMMDQHLPSYMPEQTTTTVTDPRVTKSNAGPAGKRKAEEYAAEVLDDGEPKFPRTQLGKAPQRARTGLRSQMQASVRDLPTIPTSQDSSEVARRGPKMQSRVQSLAGKKTQPASRKKQSKSM